MPPARHPHPRLAAASVAALVAAAGFAPCLGAPRIRMETVAYLRAEVVLTGPDLPGTLGYLEMEAPFHQPASATMDLPWPPGARLEIRSSGVSGPTEGTVEAEAIVLRGEEVLSRAVRRLPLGGASSTIWEVHRAQGRRIVLGVRTEGRARPAVPAAPEVGRPVGFRLFVERVHGDAATLLETNHLSTFAGQRVAYSFRRGAGPDEESLRIGLLPLRVLEDVVQVAIDLEARLPGPDAPGSLARSQTLFVTRGAESVVVAVSGDPPSGYRFRLVAEF